MTNIVSADDPTLGAAMEQLAAEMGETAPATPTPDSATTEQTAPVQAEPKVNPSKPKEDGAPATADHSKPTEPSQPASKFEKNRQRLEGGWKELNERKDALKAEQDRIKAERDEITRERQEIETARQEASKPKFTPDQYEAHSVRLTREADELEKAGKFEEADEKRVLAKKAKAYAGELRLNPPAPVNDPNAGKKAQETFLKEQKEWYGKAAVDFPSIAKKDSPEAQALLKMVNDPATRADVLGSPKALYYAARLVCAETAAARVSNLQKDLDAARAKIKEFEQLTAVPGDGSAVNHQLGEKTFEQKAPDEQFAELERQAKELGPMR